MSGDDCTPKSRKEKRKNASEKKRRHFMVANLHLREREVN